ncbi:MAG: CHAT domain-containing protein [Bacteroidota bacterium]
MKYCFTIIIFSFFLTTGSGQSLSLYEQDSIHYQRSIPLIPKLQEHIDFIASYLDTRPSGDTTTYLIKLHLELGKSYFYGGLKHRAFQQLSQVIAMCNASRPVAFLEKSDAAYHIAAIFRTLNRDPAATHWVNKSLTAIDSAIVYNPSLKLKQLRNRNRIMAANVATYNLDYALAELHIAALSPEGVPPHPAFSSEEFTQRQIEGIRLNQVLLSKDYDASVKRYQQFLRSNTAKKLEDKFTITAKNNLAQAYFALDQFAAAYENAQSALTGAQIKLDVGNTESLTEYISSLTLLMAINAKRKHFSRTDSLFQLGLAVLDTAASTDYYQLSDLYLTRSNAALQQRDLAAANRYLDTATLFIVEDSAPIKAVDLPRIEGNQIWFMDRFRIAILRRQAIYLAQAEQQQDITYLKKALSCYYSIDSTYKIHRNKLSLTVNIAAEINEAKAAYEKAISIGLQLYQATGDQSSLEEAWQIASQQKSNLLSRFLNGPALAASLGVPEALVNRKMEWEIKLLQLDNELKKSAGERRKAMGDSIIQLGQQLAELNALVAETYPKYANTIRGYQPVTVNEIINQLDKDQAVIEFSLGEDSLYVFSIDRRKGLQHTVLSLPPSLDSTVVMAIAHDTIARRLYDQILSAVLKKLPSRVNRLQLIPDGTLWNLPFSSLKNGNRYLIEDYAIGYAYAAGLLYDRDLQRDVRQFKSNFGGFGLSYGNIITSLQRSDSRSQTDANLLALASLPYATQEVETIGNMTKGSVWLNEQATKQTFLREASNHRQLHLAMHGLTDPKNPLENALVFAKQDSSTAYSLLTTQEILSLSVPAQIAVLSACHTGAGPLEFNEGLQSMARAFAFAGVATTVSSNWEASDQVTHDILINFYRNTETGMTLDVALQKAITAYLDQASPAFQDPKLWANLSLTGSVEPLARKFNWLGYGLIVALVGVGALLGLRWRSRG